MSKTQPRSSSSSKAAAASRMVKVRATAIGFYDNRRVRLGDVFMIAEADFSKNWMEKVNANTPEQITGANAALLQQSMEIAGDARGALPGVGGGPAEGL
jgi:hypothetical protein